METGGSWLLPYVVAAVPLLAYATADLVRLRERRRWPRALVAELLLISGMGLAVIQLAPRSLPFAVGVVAAGSLAVALVAARAARRGLLAAFPGMFAAAGVFGLLALGGWMHDHPGTIEESPWAQVGIVAGIALLLLFIMVRFATLQRLEESLSSSELEVRARAIWTQIAGFGVPAFLGLIAALVGLAPALDADRGVADGFAASPGFLVVSAAGLALCAVSGAFARPVPPTQYGPSGEPVIGPNGRAATLLALGFFGLAIAPVLAPASPTHLALAVPAALAVCALTTENLHYSPALLQLVLPSGKGKAVAWLGGLALGSQTFWLLGIGLGDANGPVDTEGAAAASVLVLLASAAAVFACGVTLGRSLSVPHLTLHPTWQNLLQDGLVAAFVVFCATVVPAYLVSRSPYHDSLTFSALVDGGVVAFLTWLLGNNPVHVRREQSRTPPALARRRAADLSSLRDDPEKLRARRLTHHSLWLQNGLYLALLIGGLVWLAASVPSVVPVIAVVLTVQMFELVRARQTSAGA